MGWLGVYSSKVTIAIGLKFKGLGLSRHTLGVFMGWLRVEGFRL